MIAAIYARKSTDQKDTNAADKSVARQVDHARRYAAKKGWAVDERFIFIDDGISGAEFEKRPGYLRLLASLGTKRHKAGFQILIMSEESRLGRESAKTTMAFYQIIDAGIDVWFYLDDRKLKLDSAMDKIVLAIKSGTDELAREQSSQRGYDDYLRRARNGYVTGGITFGYDNVRIGKGHVVYQINEKEAAVVRKIYSFYADERLGFKRIAHILNAQKLPSPRPQHGRPKGWDPGTIRAVLDRQIYRGRIEQNKTSKKRDLMGRQKIVKRTAEELIVIENKALRIVPEELADRVDLLRGHRRKSFLRSHEGHLMGQASHGKYLLSGLMRCPCGGNFEAQKHSSFNRRGMMYVCSIHRRKGSAVCGNRLALPIVDTDERILNVIEGEVLTPSFIDLVLDSVFTPDDVNRPALEEEAADLERQIANLTTAVKVGGDIPALVTELRAANARLQDVRRRLAPQEHHQREELRAALEQRVSDWKQVLRSNPQQGRQVLKHLVGTIYLWVGEPGDMDVSDKAKPGDRRGTENIGLADVTWRASAQIEGLLVGLKGFGNATVQGWRARRDSNPRPTASKAGALSN
jgi:site-specific DNA recombinase